MQKNRGYWTDLDYGCSLRYTVENNTSEEDDSGDYKGPETGVGITPLLDYDEMDDHYVSPSGSYESAGTQEDPWNMEAVENKAEPGDVIYFMEGEYTATIDIPSGETGNPVVITSKKRNEAEMVRENGNTVQFDIVEGSNIHVQGFKFDNGVSRGVYISKSEDIVVRDNHFYTAGKWSHGLDVTESNDIQIINNRFNWSEKGELVDAGDWNSDDIRVVGNSLRIGKHGTLGTSGTTDVVIRANSFINPIGRAGGTVHQGKNGLVENNVFSNALPGPGSGSTSTKFDQTGNIIRFNRWYDVYGGFTTTSVYQEDDDIDHVRLYSNTVHDTYDLSVYDGTAIFAAGHGSDPDRGYVSDYEVENNIFQDIGIGNEETDELGLDVERKFLYILLDPGIEFSENYFGSTNGEPMAVVDYETVKLSEAIENVEEVFLGGNEVGDNPSFLDQDNYDHRLETSSELVDGGKYLTKTIESGSGKELQVKDPHYFWSGREIPRETGDRIQIGQKIVKIGDIDGTTIKVNESISWKENEPVGIPWGGERPDLGAYEREGRKQVIINKSDHIIDSGQKAFFEAELRNIKAEEICWQFGDGSGSCGKQVNHTYEGNRGYGVRIRVLDDKNRTHWDSAYIQVQGEGPDVTSIEHNKHLTEKYVCDGEEGPYSEAGETELYYTSEGNEGNYECR